MKKTLKYNFIWIPHELGGHNASPYKGMRTLIRWQKFLAEYLDNSRVIQWETLTFDPETLQGTAVGSFTPNEPPPDDWLRDGELVEFIGSYNVLAVGRISSK